VADHLAPNAFVADLILYDRLVVPVPDGDDAERWERNGWDPQRQSALLAAAGPSILAVPWTGVLQERVQREIAYSAGLISYQALRAQRYAQSRVSLSEEIAGPAPRSRDVRAVTVYAAPDRFQREWRIARSIPFVVRRTSTLIPGTLFEGTGPASGDQELVRLLAARLLVPVDGRDDVMTLARTAELLHDSDIPQRRAELHEMITEFQARGLRADAIVDEIETQIAEINDIVRRRRRHHIAQLALLAFSTALGAAAINTPLLSVAAGPTAVAGAALINRRWRAEPAPEEAAPVAALLAQARRALET